MKLATASFILLASHIAFATVVQRSQQGGILRRLLEVRQSVPSLPQTPSDEGACGNTCANWENQLTPCGENEADIWTCMCTQGIVDAMVQCYDCLIPLVQQAGTDPQFAQEAQSAVDDYGQACSQMGHPVKTGQLNGNSAPSTQTGGSGDNTATNTATGGSGGGGSPTTGAGPSTQTAPGGAPGLKPNGAMGAVAFSEILMLGMAGGAAVVMGL